MSRYDAVILGAGAAGLFAAGIAAQRGLTVLLIDHAKAPGEKIRISGGGRCNFTNIHTRPEAFLSENPHFAKSALARYTAEDFIALVRRHGIAFHEKTLGQLFCDGSSREIIAMLRAELGPAESAPRDRCRGDRHADGGFTLRLADGTSVTTGNLVIATGGKSIPKMGASGFGYQRRPPVRPRADRNPSGAGAADLRAAKTSTG